jgi:hypothetical protein
LGIPRKTERVDGRSRAGEFAFRDERWSKRYPHLWEFVARIRWPAVSGADPEGGDEREPGSLIIFVDDFGLLKACLSDKDTGQVAFVSSDSLEGLLDASERGLAEDRLDWRPSQISAAARKRKG